MSGASVVVFAFNPGKLAKNNCKNSIYKFILKVVKVLMLSCHCNYLKVSIKHAFPGDQCVCVCVCVGSHLCRFITSAGVKHAG